jgi:Heparinase II/III-like protein/Heparinase II/III N-terminus
MSSSQLAWHWNRLRSMRPAEMAWRTGSVLRTPLEWARSKVALTVECEPARQNPYPVSIQDCGERMEQIQIFHLTFPVGFAFDWHRDYRHGGIAPAKFSKLINLRGSRTLIDVKYIWECNRHQFLSALAFSSNQQDAHSYILSCLDSWIAQNPYLTGINWTSSLELGLRMISWALCFPLIESSITSHRERLRKFSHIVKAHLHAINSNLSWHSSANNHLIGEAAGLYVGSLCFPWWNECHKWRHRAHRILESQIVEQVTSDGVNKEQATSYHLFTLELFLLSCILGHNAGETYSETYLQRLYAMLSYIYTIATPTQALPWFGDSDDGRGFLCSSGETNLQVVMDIGGRLFKEPRWRKLAARETSASRALQPAIDHRLTVNSATPNSKPGLFEQGGVGVLETQNGAKLVMDFGPLGYTTIAAHGHADALSFVLALDSEYFLIDPGTYAYHSHPEWRTYFRSTAAHNTARVDGLDQSTMAGPFLWTQKANSKLLSYMDNADEGAIVAEHDAYQRLHDPVIHRRSLRFDKQNSEVTIADSFLCQGQHDVELFFHVHPEATVTETHSHGVEVRWRTKRVMFRNQSALCQVFRGSERPILGWCSTAFDTKQPIVTLRFSQSITGSTTLISTIQIHSL